MNTKEFTFFKSKYIQLQAKFYDAIKRGTIYARKLGATEKSEDVDSQTTTAGGALNLVRLHCKSTRKFRKVARCMQFFFFFFTRSIPTHIYLVLLLLCLGKTKVSLSTR